MLALPPACPGLAPRRVSTGSLSRRQAVGLPPLLLVPRCTAAEPLAESVADVVVWQRPPSLRRVTAPAGFGPLLILPGFGNDTSDYEAPFGVAEASLTIALRSRGFTARVLPVDRRDWFNVARALLTPAFYAGTCTPREGYGWYLDRVATAVEQASEEAGGAQVTLVGHSAGGWLARAFLASVPRATRARVSGLVSLGSPHTAPPAGVTDVTRGALGWLNTGWPGAFFAPEVRYISVAGRTVTGRPGLAKDADGKRRPPAYAASSYSTLVGGDGDGVVGDAVVPLSVALLEGAQHVELPGVWHSVSRVGTFDEASGVSWYGSGEVVDSWLLPLCAGQ
jgi:pimeloyl-ACP methyl ester carboxylesterase